MLETTVIVSAPIHKSCETKPAKPAWGGVGIVRGKVGMFLAATNGKMMAAIPTIAAMEPFAGNVIPATVLAHASRPGTKSIMLKLNGTARGCHPKHGDCESAFVDGDFPPVSVLVAPALGREYRAVSLDVDFLRTLADSMNAKDGLVTLLLPEGNHAIIVIPRGAEGFGMLMPCCTAANAVADGLTRVSELA